MWQFFPGIKMWICLCLAFSLGQRFRLFCSFQTRRFNGFEQFRQTGRFALFEQFRQVTVSPDCYCCV
jgi:hypothetical protein